jgi:hypothetical protein
VSFLTTVHVHLPAVAMDVELSIPSDVEGPVPAQ